MKSIRFRIARLFVGCIILAFLMSLPDQSGLFATSAGEKRSVPPPEGGSSPVFYDIGTPTLTELWVNPVTGRDTNPGTSSSAPLKTLTAAWKKIPAMLTTTGYRVNLQPGVYPCEPAEPDNCQNNFGGRTGAYAFPIILSATGGPGTTTIRGGFDLANLSYFYLMDLTLAGGGALPTNSSGNNLLHLASVDHILLSGVSLEGPDCVADTCTNLQEVLKVNQAKYLYVENSNMGGAWHTTVDYFAVQYGHFINNDLHTAGQWCMYIKGGTSYLRVEANEFHNCQLGFSAGQSANFPMMVPPWLQYEAYDIKFVNNILYDLPGVGLSAAGGYNILFAYNTLYRVGISTDIGYPLLSVVRGERGCSATDELPNPAPRCNTYIGQGGWGPNRPTDNVEAIPNRSVYFYNNLFYNPAPTHTQYAHFNIVEPVPRPAGFPSTMPASITADNNLVFAGNVIWNGDAAMPLGIEDTPGACHNTTCNATQLRAENAINTVAPQLANPSGGDFHPIGSWATDITTYAIPNFIWDIAGLPAGETSNAVPTDYEGVTRAAVDLPGAYHTVTPPVALSILRTSASPTTAASVNFSVTFSEPVTGVDKNDFALVTSNGITGAAVTTVSGSGTSYTVSVKTGAGSGSLRLNLVDDDSIVDAGNVPLGGEGANNGDFSTGQTYIVRPLTQAFVSAAAQDGWVLESSETGSVGGSIDSDAATFNLGDDATKKQYRGILSFSTGSLPDSAVITGVTLKVRQQAIRGGGNPVTAFGGFMLDIKNGPFGAAALQTGDFQAAAGKSYGPFNTPLVGGWYNIDLTAAKGYVNKLATNSGLTQTRLRFKLDDNNNAVANVLSLYSGNAPAASRPQLVITYIVP
jgi:hypothetical protein